MKKSTCALVFCALMTATACADGTSGVEATTANGSKINLTYSLATNTFSGNAVATTVAQGNSFLNQRSSAGQPNILYTGTAVMNDVTGLSFVSVPAQLTVNANTLSADFDIGSSLLSPAPALSGSGVLNGTSIQSTSFTGNDSIGNTWNGNYNGQLFGPEANLAGITFNANSISANSSVSGGAALKR